MKQLYTLKFINFKQEQTIFIESSRSVQELIELGIQNLKLTEEATYEIISTIPIELTLQLQSLPQSMHNRLIIKLIHEIDVEFYSEDYESSSNEKVNIFDKLIELNMMIHLTLGISSAPQKIQYTLGNKQLNPLKTLYKQQITQNQQIKYTIFCQFFVLHNKKKKFFQCKINELISNIKKDIKNQFEIEENFDLKYENQTLLNGDEYGSYCVPLNHIFCLQIIDSVNLRVSFQGKTQNIEVLLSETVETLINFFTNRNNYCLMHGRKILNNSESLKNLNLPNNELLELKLQLEIYYNLDGFEEIIKGTLLENQTFQDLLNQIKIECGIPPETNISIFLNENQIDPNKVVVFEDQQNQYVVRINE